MNEEQGIQLPSIDRPSFDGRQLGQHGFLIFLTLRLPKIYVQLNVELVSHFLSPSCAQECTALSL